MVKISKPAAGPPDQGFRLVKSSTLPLTRDLALKFRDMEPSPTERDLNPKRVAHLNYKAESGFLIAFHWATAMLNGRAVRMNGQHSSVMLTNLNGAFPKGLHVHLDEYECDSTEALALLFQQFDDRKSSRSPTDISGAHQGLHDNLHDVPKAIAKLAVEGVAWHDRFVVGAPTAMTDDRRYMLFHQTQFHPFILWLGKVITRKTSEFKNVGVVAAMYATYTKNMEEADKFWTVAGHGGEPYNDTAPVTALYTFLKAPADKDGKKYNESQLYQGSIFAWNAYRAEKLIKEINPSTRKGFTRASE